MKTIAIVCANGLGDGLLFMILSQNFYLSGYQVTTFSDALLGLQKWFPHQRILPFPSSDRIESVFSSFDQIIAADHSILSECTFPYSALTVLKEQAFNKTSSLVENLSSLCKTLFQIPFSDKGNGIQIPAHLRFRHHANRVIIHPMSLEEKRAWPAQKFLSLALELARHNWQPIICVSLSERPLFEKYVASFKEISLPFFSSLEELASYIFESGWMIGNNSGIGHLASALGIPTLSLFSRKSYARLWRPGWSTGTVVTPPRLLIGAGAMNRHWKKLLSKQRVLRAFDNFVKTTSYGRRGETLAHPSPKLNSSKGG